jgi:hypothetical protein
MAKIHKQSFINKGRGYSFSLFPILDFSKSLYYKKDIYTLVIGVWFWALEINWIKKVE